MKNILLLLLFINSASAQDFNWFEGGFWWNPDESGRGLTMEISKGIAVIAFYGYDDMNLGRWYLGSGAMDLNNDTITGNWNAYDDGQCAGCSYTPAILNMEKSKGQFTITFHSHRKATMQWSGGEMPLERFNFAYPTPNSFLFGVFGGVTIINGSSSVEFVVFENQETETDTGNVVMGKSLYTDRPILGTHFADDENGDHLYAVIADSTPEYNSYFEFKAGVNGFIGFVWLYPKGGEPTGLGDTFIAAKYFDFVDVSTFKTQKLKTTKPGVSNIPFSGNLDSLKILESHLRKK